MGRKMKKQQQLGYTRQAVDDDGKEASTKNLNPKARVSRHVSWRQRAGRQPKLPRVTVDRPHLPTAAYLTPSLIHRWLPQYERTMSAGTGTWPEGKEMAMET